VADLRALDALDGGEVIIQSAGAYEAPQDVDWSDGDSWLTIRAADGLDPSDPSTRVRLLTSNHCGYYSCVRPNASLLKWENIAIDSDEVYYQQHSIDALHWFDRCYSFDSAGWLKTRPVSVLNTNYRGKGYYSTNSVRTHIRGGFTGAHIARNSRLETISGDAFSNAKLVINGEITQFHNVVSGDHADIYQLWGGTTESPKKNYILFGVRASDVDSVQNLLLDSTSSVFENIAVVDFVVENTGSEASHMSSAESHVLLSNISMPAQQLILRDDEESTSSPLVAEDVVLQNIVVSRLFRGSWYFYGVPEGVTLRNSHIKHEHRIFETDEGVSDLSIGDLDLEFAEGTGWTYTGAGASMLIGTGIPIPGFLETPVDKGFVNRE